MFHDKKEIIELVGRKIMKINHYFGDKSTYVELSLGFYEPFIIKGWNILRYYNNIVGRASPNHCLDISENLRKSW